MNKSEEQYSSESSDSEKSHPVGEEGGIDALIGDFEDQQKDFIKQGEKKDAKSLLEDLEDESKSG